MQLYETCQVFVLGAKRSPEAKAGSDGVTPANSRPRTDAHDHVTKVGQEETGPEVRKILSPRQQPEATRWQMWVDLKGARPYHTKPNCCPGFSGLVIGKGQHRM